VRTPTVKVRIAGLMQLQTASKSTNLVPVSSSRSLSWKFRNIRAKEVPEACMLCVLSVECTASVELLRVT